MTTSIAEATRRPYEPDRPDPREVSLDHGVQMAGEHLIELLQAIDGLDNYWYHGSRDADGGDAAVQVVTMVGGRIRQEAMDCLLIEDLPNGGGIMPGRVLCEARDTLFRTRGENGGAS